MNKQIKWALLVCAALVVAYIVNEALNPSPGQQWCEKKYSDYTRVIYTDNTLLVKSPACQYKYGDQGLIHYLTEEEMLEINNS